MSASHRQRLLRGHYWNWQTENSFTNNLRFCTNWTWLVPGWGFYKRLFSLPRPILLLHCPAPLLCVCWINQNICAILIHLQTLNEMYFSSLWTLPISILHLINWGVWVSTFCAVLALGTWKLLTSWGFCGSFDDWQDQLWILANQWHSSKLSVYKLGHFEPEDIMFCDTNYCLFSLLWP